MITVTTVIIFHREEEVDDATEAASQQPADEWGEAGKLMRSGEPRKSRSPPLRRRCVIAKVTLIVAFSSL